MSTASIPAPIAAILLDDVVDRFLAKKPGWTLVAAKEVEVMYRRFLTLIFEGHKQMTPTDYVDDMWHAHILDTEKYPVSDKCTCRFSDLIEISDGQEVVCITCGKAP